MAWKVLLEIVLALAVLFVASGFWATAKSPAHLRRLLNDPSELERIYHFMGPEKLRQEAAQIRPVAGSYAGNISMWDAAHRGSLSRTRNLMGIGVLVLLFLSWLLGPGYLATSLTVFAILALPEISVSAKNNNVTHLHSVILNVIKWNQSDSAACWEYCRNRSPTLEHLYAILNGVRSG